MKSIAAKEYAAALQERGKKARVTQQFQMIGLEIATILRDFEHKAIYIKYTKELGSERMLMLAKDVASRRDVKNRGAYFMKVAKEYREKIKSKK